MTIAEAISQLDSRKPNQFSNSDKIEWLSELDGRFKREVIDNAEGSEDHPFSGYTSASSTNTVLLIPEPYSQVYLSWLASRVDYWNAEYTRYQSTAATFNMDYKSAADAWYREHKPLQRHRTIAR